MHGEIFAKTRQKASQRIDPATLDIRAFQREYDKAWTEVIAEFREEQARSLHRLFVSAVIQMADRESTWISLRAFGNKADDPFIVDQVQRLTDKITRDNPKLAIKTYLIKGRCSELMLQICWNDK